MNKKVIITVLAIILIIGLAIFTGVNLSKADSKQPTEEPVNNTTQITKPTDEVTATETPVLESPEPSEAPTTPTPNKDSSKMNVEQKKEYAKSIAKSTWEKLGVEKQVYYSFGNITSDGKYLIAVRDEATTEALVWYEIDIVTGTCEITY